jgi:glycyl-tRNA synthetase beta subunit
MFNPINQNALEDAEIRVFIGTQPNGPIDPYGIGRAATEFLVASVGFQKLLEIFALFKETRNFEKSFERATGVSTAFFYSRFEMVRSKLGMYDVSMKLVCLTNTPLKDVPQVRPVCEIKSTQP